MAWAPGAYRSHGVFFSFFVIAKNENLNFIQNDVSKFSENEKTRWIFAEFVAKFCESSL